MSADIFSASPRALRGIDDNTLLRLMDRARDYLRGDRAGKEPARARKVLQRVTAELTKRGIDASAGPTRGAMPWG